MNELSGCLYSQFPVLHREAVKEVFLPYFDGGMYCILQITIYK
jgi:hypothetical protein